MNKKTIIITFALFITNIHTINSSYLSPLLTWFTEQPSPTTELPTKGHKKNSWVEVSADSQNNLSDVTIPRLVTINDQPEIRTISPRGRQLSTNDYNNNKTQMRTLSLPNRTIADQTNPTRKPRSRSSRPIQAPTTQVAQRHACNNPANSTAQLRTIHIILKKQPTS